MTFEVPVYRRDVLCAYSLVDEDTFALIDGRPLRMMCTHAFLAGVALHRLVMGCTKNDGKVVHHINEDPTDNRRVNLLVVDSMLEHGALPHPWRDRLCTLVQTEPDRAWEIVEDERVAAGLRPVHGMPVRRLTGRRTLVARINEYGIRS